MVDMPMPNWKTLAVHAIILGGSAFVAALGNTVPDTSTIYIAFKMFGVAFFGELVYELHLQSNGKAWAGAVADMITSGKSVASNIPPASVTTGSSITVISNGQTGSLPADQDSPDAGDSGVAPPAP